MTASLSPKLFSLSRWEYFDANSLCSFYHLIIDAFPEGFPILHVSCFVVRRNFPEFLR